MPGRGLMDVVKEVMKRVSVTKEDARDGVIWRQMLCCDKP